MQRRDQLDLAVPAVDRGVLIIFFEVVVLFVIVVLVRGGEGRCGEDTDEGMS